MSSELSETDRQIQGMPMITRARSPLQSMACYC